MIAAHVQPRDARRNRRAKVGIGLPFARNLLGRAIVALAVDEVTTDNDAVGRKAQDEGREKGFGGGGTGRVAEADVKVAQVDAAKEPIFT